MAGNFSMRIKPSEFQKIQKKFKSLVDRTQQKVVKKAVKETLKPVQTAVKSKAPKGESGMLKRSIRITTKGYRRNGIVVGMVGVARIAKEVNGKLVKPSMYAHLVEYGTKAHGPKTKKIMSNGKMVFGKRVRGTNARPFLRPTWDANRGSMERDVRTRVGRGIESIAKGL